MKAKDVIKGIEEGFDDNEQIADAVAWVEDTANHLAELTAEHDAIKKDHKTLERKLICCHVAAKHPDRMLSRTGVYIEKWDSQSAEAVRALRDERDALQAELTSLKSEINDQENELNEYRNVMAECRKRLGLAEDADGFDTFTAVGRVVAELTALKAAQEWRGMESAPRDGLVLLLRTKYGVYSAYFSDDHQDWVSNVADNERIIDPIGWLPAPPLPTPPQEQSHD